MRYDGTDDEETDDTTIAPPSVFGRQSSETNQARTLNPPIRIPEDRSQAGDEGQPSSLPRGDQTPDEPDEERSPEGRGGGQINSEEGPMPREQQHGQPAIFDVYGRQQAPGGPSPQQLAAMHFQQQMASLPPPMRAQLQYEMTKLSIGEQLRKQRLEQGMAYVDQQDSLSGEEKAALKMQMSTGLNQYKIREMKAHALMQEMRTQQMESAVTKQHALETTLNSQREKFAALSKKSPDGTFDLPGLHGRFQINRHGEAELVKDMTHKDNAAEAKADAKIEKDDAVALKDWRASNDKALAHADKQVGVQRKAREKIADEMRAKGQFDAATNVMNQFEETVPARREELRASYMHGAGHEPTVEEHKSARATLKPPPPPPGGTLPQQPAALAAPGPGQAQPAPGPSAAPPTPSAIPQDPAAIKAKLVQKWDDAQKQIEETSANHLQGDEKEEAVKLIKRIKAHASIHGSTTTGGTAMDQKKMAEDLMRLNEISTLIARRKRIYQ